MKKLSPEEIVALATSFSIEISKNKSKTELCSCKTFFQVVANNLQAIINEKK